mmetsp:Transcript_23863/g.53743  ORF Transcript_23863/g.53743 Transcript_23863/m.53743 type:complete len:259 (-) Transcript_23863:63-839(-)
MSSIMDCLDAAARSFLEFFRCCPSWVTCCCCVKTYDRDDAIQQMLSDTTDPRGPSLLGRLCWCQCAPVPRQPSGIEDIEAIANFAGITLQAGDHVTGGTLENLRFGDYDPATRTLLVAIFGGWRQTYNTGIWSEPAGDPIFAFLMWLARVGNATYEIKFSEDFQQASIVPRGNLGIFCCCCCPCIPAWFPVPTWLLAYTIVQADDSVKGDHWERFMSSFGSEPRFYYDIYTVYTQDGAETRWTNEVSKWAPAQVMLSF